MMPEACELHSRCPVLAPIPFTRTVPVVVLAGLSACGHKSSGSSGVAQTGEYKIGNPYTIDGVTYARRINHVETGVASW